MTKFFRLLTKPLSQMQMILQRQKVSSQVSHQALGGFGRNIPLTLWKEHYKARKIGFAGIYYLNVFGGCNSANFNFHKLTYKTIVPYRINGCNKNVLSVAVTVSPTLEQVKTAYDCGFDYIQIHGEVGGDVLSNPYLKVIRAFNVSDLEKFDEYRMNQNIVGYVFDANEPGSGKTFDWTMLENLPRDDKLFMLAGGLNPETVAKAEKPLSLTELM